MKFIFINKELAFEANGQRMQGFTGIPYGNQCRWNNELCAQTVEATFETKAEYIACLEDIKGAWDAPMRRWMPMPVDGWETKAVAFVQQESPVRKTPFQSVIDEDLNVIDPTLVSSEKQQTIDASTPYKRLVKIATTEGVDISMCQSNSDRASAINAKRNLVSV